MQNLSPQASLPTQSADSDQQSTEVPTATPPIEFDGPKGSEPTRFGDWERKGRCIDF